MALLQGAAIEALREDINTMEIKDEHVMKSFNSISPQITQDMLDFYQGYMS